MKKLYQRPLMLFLFIILSHTGCASIPDTSIWADEYITNIEIAKENAVKIATISEFKTCFIRACLGCHIDKLSHEMVVVLDDIDKLLEKIGTDYDKMTDCQKGQILGLWTRLVTLGVLESIEAINPGVLGALL